MGDEIRKTRFGAVDFAAFQRGLQRDTERLAQWLDSAAEPVGVPTMGLELEAWLVNAELRPAPLNESFLKLAGCALFSPELARFNIEINTEPLPLAGDCFARMEEQLRKSWKLVTDTAARLDCQAVMIGSLPTATQADVTLANISPLRRYKAINQRTSALRQGKPVKINISGREHLSCELKDVMFESATTSLQLHLRVPAAKAAVYYNASLVASAFTVAVAANAPFVFGRNLWQDSRIPLFEQTVDVGGYGAAKGGPIRRVSFGSGYLRASILELFQENLEHFPVLLPQRYDENEAAQLPYLRLHNGTIYRWNRPVVGFEAGGEPHIRIEHRVMSAGPTAGDMVANALLYYGLVQGLVISGNPFTELLPFAQARDNFYKAAQHGLDARVTWLDGYSHRLQTLMLKEILFLTRAGLVDLGIARTDIDRYLEVLRERIDGGQTGAVWQRRFVQATDRDMPLLLRHYLEQQNSGQPVSRWPVPDLALVEEERLFDIRDDLPPGFLDIEPGKLHELLPRPTLLRIAGAEGAPLFVSILLHGNETSGLAIMQQLLRKYEGGKYEGKPLPRPLLLFVGNVQAARYGLRRLEVQADYNRCWPGTEVADCAETRMLRQLFAILLRSRPLLSIDLHNNTGDNPHYACINRLDPRFIQLAALFSRTIIYFVRPLGVQSSAMARICPATTLECGKVGDTQGIARSLAFLEHCLQLQELKPQVPEDIELYHSIAQVRVNAKYTFGFAGETLDLLLNPELERSNFKELPAGTLFARLGREIEQPLIVEDELGQDVFARYFILKDGVIRTRNPLLPSMLTQDLRVIEQDCLCYLMERFPLLG